MAKNAGTVLADDDVDDDATPVRKRRAKAEVRHEVPSASSPGTKRIRIILEENENIPPTGQYFGINGRGYILKAGEEADVPVEIINVLNDAVMAVPQVDPSTQQVVGYRQRLRFPYRVVTQSA